MFRPLLRLATAPILGILGVASVAAGTPHDHHAHADRSTPPDAHQYPAPQPVVSGTASDSTIAAMVAAVEPDSIESVLAQISGEVTVDLGWGPLNLVSRYYDGSGAEHSAELLRRMFESFGYDAQLDYFRFLTSLESILVDGSGAGITVGGKGRVLRTEDGSAWLKARDGVELHEGNTRDVDLVSGDEYVIVGNSGLIATTADGGQNWTVRTSSATGRLNGVDVRASGVGWIAGKTGTILATTDGGATWADQISGVGVMLHDVVSLDDQTAVVVGDGGTIVRTTDGGASWNAATSGTASDLGALAAAGAGVWAVGNAGTILASTDSGATWSAQTSGTASNLNDVSFPDAASGWAVGVSGTVLSTSNGGATWNVETSPSTGITHRGVHAVTASDVWVVGTSGQLGHTTDGGASWTDANPTIEDGSANVVATKAGTTSPSEEVLLIGHYDSISDAADPAVLAPGADDNGTGTTVLVEAARVMANASYERTIRFVAMGDEEVGLVGSDAYAHRAQQNGDDLVAVFNLDMVGWNDTYFRILSNASSAWFGDIALAMAGTHAPSLPAFHWDCPTCNWSDHWSFWQHGFDAIVGIQTWEPPPPHYHTVGDTLGNLDMNLVANVTKIALSTIATVAGVDTSGANAVKTITPAAPRGFQLHAGMPNPMRTATTIRFDLPSRENVQLRIYDVNGRRVRSLVAGPVAAGSHQVVWDGTDSAGKRVTAGVYFYRIIAGEHRASRKLVRIR